MEACAALHVHAFDQINLIEAPLADARQSTQSSFQV
jgi:hypothetical protein